MIEIRNLRKEFGSSVILKDISCEIKDGDIIALIGGSGCGKSTLLRCLNLLERPTSGQILLNGQDITAKGCDVPQVRRKMGMVFQSFNLFDHLTVIENVMYAPVKLLGLSRQEAYDRAVELLRSVGMESRQMSYPDQMSGGQRQRVAIARALAMDPEIILFDEPTSALDPRMTAEVQKVIRDLALQKKTMMIVTHEMRFAREISNRVFYMDEGLIYEEGTPEEIFEHPKRTKTLRFIRSLRVLEIDIVPDMAGFAEASGEIGRYLGRNQIPPEMCIRLQSVIEELCAQILAPELEDAVMHLTLEYDPAAEKAEVTVEYPGSFRPEDTANTLAWSILKARSESIAHETDPEAAMSTVKIKIG